MLVTVRLDKHPQQLGDMKFLAFVLVATFVVAQADFVRLNLDNEIAALVNEVNSPRHVREANPLTTATQTVLGQVLEGKLKNITDKINSLVATGHVVGKGLLEQAKQIADQLKEMGGKYLTDAKAILSTLKSQFSGWFQGLLDMFGGLFGKRDLFENFEEELLDETVALVLADRGVAEWWQGVKDTFSQVLGGFSSKFADLQVFVKQFAGDLWGKVKGHFDNVKLIAQEYLAHAKDASLAATKELLEFLEPYKQDLGSLWTQVVQAAYNVKHIVLTGSTPPSVPPTTPL
ncbi:uncharacterized protein LOC106166857 isoform X1 [Lingula anatina]|uniref:Uncharacterized protein LOC106166857 isoform X1 n=2 Tax=Lingula anatina TaxID=7574 RepID=A0A1S3ISR1_LINAN|nr:uncharacterized protein LOC106166857 isoform X1 [Lingula anatina]|eukprot:XP_013400976.1 uncharacterized protein LOC106166857 isoform X1 [Lingula anatina]